MRVEEEQIVEAIVTHDWLNWGRREQGMGREDWRVGGNYGPPLRGVRSWSKEAGVLRKGGRERGREGWREGKGAG